MVCISVPKSAEIGAFEGKIRMSAILEIKGSFFDRKFAKSEEGDPIYPTLISYSVS